MAPSSAFASAPASERAPPISHAARNAHWFGRAAATVPGVRKIPTPMTDETTSIVASKGESWGSRRSRGWRAEVTRVVVYDGTGGVAKDRDKCGGSLAMFWPRSIVLVEAFFTREGSPRRLYRNRPAAYIHRARKPFGPR